MFQHEQVVALAIEAGNAILEIYNKGSTIDVMTKDDNSPLTDADLAAHRVIVEGLQEWVIPYRLTYVGWSTLSTEPRNLSRGTVCSPST